MVNIDKEKIGLVLIILGVLVWPVGLFVLHLRPVPDCLVPHLCLVIPGAILKGGRIGRLIKG